MINVESCYNGGQKCITIDACVSRVSYTTDIRTLVNPGSAWSIGLWTTRPQAYSQLTLISIVTTWCTPVVSAIGSLTTQSSSSSSPGPLRWGTRRNHQQAYFYKLFVPSSLSCQLANADKKRCRKACPSNRGRVLEVGCAVQGLRFSNPFINLYGYIYFSSCFSFLLQIDGFLFSFFFRFEIGWLTSYVCKSFWCG